MHFVTGNLLDSESEALVNTVNTVGVMGKGIALQFKETFPNNFKEYVQACKTGELRIGSLLVVRERIITGERVIINFPTKTQWYLKSKYEYIEEGLKELVNVIHSYRIKSIAIPPLGCGNGGLKWERVKDLIQKYLSPIQDVKVTVYEPSAEVKEILKRESSSKKSKLTPARAMLLYAMFYYESSGESSSLFVANKLAYLLQRLGESSMNRMKFQANHYGPYAVQVEHMLLALNGEYIRGLEQMSVKAFEPIVLKYDKMQEVSDYVRKELHEDQRNRVKNLIDLIDGFQSALALEVLATVDFIKRSNPEFSKEQVVESIKSWSNRKSNLFKDRHISIALSHLQEYAKRASLSS
ncbi:O-acetyl-ADP-ribose deacetylase (regulator of RNase III), contains Macro domain [Dyadobacter soli]|uniref:O-acetyl-ADP-ribose deacetylase (Regulator of RNase III), contains Macro domain n=1 Tax=Dyadobacter soli TaxID=659014 RepID=A0A1G7QJA5_9BACT|nr:macro domain-containing protein [Dyadobacter soli]SDF98582.1 O-acetyl-ADP-ribose deacetylase (regulator of RNase III), contains Macro domain [Dyadobacter soli]